MRGRLVSGRKARLMRAGAVAGALLAVAGGSGVAQAAGPAGGTRHGDHATAPWTISTLAGGDGGPGTATSVALKPCGVSYGNGSPYVGNGVIQKVSPVSDRLTTAAGSGDTYPLGDGGPATAASVESCITTFDHAGNLVVVNDGSRVRVVANSTATFYGQNMTAGDIYTVAGDGLRGISGDGGPGTAAELDGPGGVTVTPAGDLLIADFYSNRVRALAG
jgi:hypothetical protein